MTDLSTLIGKTIATARECPDWREDGDILVTFTDGTAMTLTATGYEADGINVDALSRSEKLRRAAELAGQREADRVKRLAAETLRLRREALKATMTTEQWEAWMDEHEPGWRQAKLLADMFESSIRAQMQSMSLLMRHQHYGEGDHVGGFAVIPIEREAASGGDS
jgi:hypothetical protein